jgi:ABC-type nitrate/sulfonate/bicarbonate transport system permease component
MGTLNEISASKLRLAIDSKLVYTALGILGGLLIWEVAGQSLPNTLLAPFSDVVDQWFILARDGTLFDATLSSLKHMVAGFILAVVIGIPLGFAMGRIRPLYWALDPPLSAIYATPVVALIPLIVVWFGLGFKAKAFIVFLMAFIELVVNVYQGVFEIPDGYLETAQSFGASRFETYTQVLIPAAAPFITAGLRLSIGRAVRGMITAEIFLAASGLGELLMSAGLGFDISIQLAIIITVTAIGIFAQSMVKYADNNLVHWG